MSRKRTFLALLLATAVTLCDAARCLATFPGINGDIVFVKPVEEPGPSRGDLYRMKSDGTGVTPITAFGANFNFENPVWDASGGAKGKLAFWAYNVHVASQVFLDVVDGDGQNLMTLSPVQGGNITDSGPSWSPDGKKLVVAFSDGIYAFDLETPGFTPIVQNPSADVRYDQPSWSPLGDRIAFRIRHLGVGAYSFVNDIGTVPAGGGPVTNLTNGQNVDGLGTDDGCEIGGPGWAPDGSTIVFHTGDCMRPADLGSGPQPPERSRLVSVSSSGGIVTLLTPLAFTQGVYLTNPRYSAGGGTIVFEYREGSILDATPEIATLPYYGGSLDAIFNTQVVGRTPDWQALFPDAKLRLRFDTFRTDSFGFEIFEVNADGFQVSTATLTLTDQDDMPLGSQDIQLSPGVLVDPRFSTNPRNVMCQRTDASGLGGSRLWPGRLGPAIDFLAKPIVTTDAGGEVSVRVLAGSQVGTEWPLEATATTHPGVTIGKFLDLIGTVESSVDVTNLRAGLTAQVMGPYRPSPFGTAAEKQATLLAWLGQLRWQGGFFTKVEYAPVHAGTHAGIVFYPGGSSPNPLLNYLLAGPGAGDPATFYVIDTDELGPSVNDDQSPVFTFPQVGLRTLAEWETAVGTKAVAGSLAPSGEEDLQYFGYPYPPPGGIEDATDDRAAFARCIDLAGVSVDVHSPLNLVFKDSQGRELGVDAAGTYHYGAPGVIAGAGGANPTGYALPPGDYTVTVAGTGGGASTLVFTNVGGGTANTTVFDLKAKARTTGTLALGPNGPAASFKFGKKKVKAKAGIGLVVAGLPKKVKRNVETTLAVTVTDQFGAAVGDASIVLAAGDFSVSATTAADGTASIVLTPPAAKKMLATISAADHAPATQKIKIKR